VVLSPCKYQKPLLKPKRDNFFLVKTKNCHYFTAMTVLEARNLLLRYVGPLDSTTDIDFLKALNQLRRRFFDSGKWNGLVVETEVTVSGVEYVFILPDNCESILGAQINGKPVVVFGRYHEYLPGGPGEIVDSGGAAQAIVDQGDRCYKVLGKGDRDVTLRLTCKRRYVPLDSDDDIVTPDNDGALKLGLMSLSYEDNNDLERADQYFAKALSILNGEVKEARGAAQSVLQQSPHGFHLGRIRNLY